MKSLLEKEVKFLPIYDSRYPDKLKHISTAPYALYIRGKMPQNCFSVAIVGARECSSYGRSMAEEFAKALAREGVHIISGMANGVDSASQRGALDEGGISFGVLGCGVDICYPREQISLYTRLKEEGGLVSEFALGEKPLPQHFPARNRIISGLADVVLVIEAKEKSGSLITADMALEQGKDVYALPGPVNSSLSRGCNLLIRQGAGILLTPEELLEELGIRRLKKLEKKPDEKILLETAENIVYSCLGFYPKNVEQITQEAKLPIGEVLCTLTGLELKGYVKEISKNHYVRNR
jgi:DNA processing protein